MHGKEGDPRVWQDQIQIIPALHTTSVILDQAFNLSKYHFSHSYYHIYLLGMSEIMYVNQSTW